ncbi:MAG: chemotaxis protein CheW [Gallionella sp.]
MRELFLASFGGIQYGIWKDEIRSVRDIDALHRIPLSPANIAGIVIEDGQTVTLADLSACIGYEHSTERGQGSILLMEQGEKVTGFVVSGEIDTQPIPPELLFELPDYLKTPVFDSCAVHGGIPIPIINVAELYSRMMKVGEESSPDSWRILDSWRIFAAQPQEISGEVRVGFFDAGGELFAASAEGMDNKPVKPGPVTPLPNTPKYVKGVTFREGRLLPVIDMPLRIKGQRGALESLMLIAEIGGDAFGLLVDGDEGTLPANKVSIKPAPLIVQTSWLKHMVVREGKLIPLIDLARALSRVPGAGDENHPGQRYTPGSRFPALFFKHDVDVVEFSLLGERHALPKDEVEDVIAFKPCRELPDAPPIVIGAAEHNGEILPVVDLAMMFGRRSLTTPSWRMMLVNNGDFRALVITESVFKERRLSLDIHRAVPIQLPHNLMYGCYPDAEAVRLILNVEAISVHFEKTLIQTFLPGLSHEMRMMSTDADQVPAVEIAAPLSPAGTEDLAAQEQERGHQRVDGPAAGLQREAGEESVESIEMQIAAAAPSPSPSPSPSPAVPEFIQPTEEQFVEWLEADIAALAIAPEPELSDGAALEQEPVPPAEAVSEITNVREPEAMSGESTGQEFLAEQKNLVAALLRAVPEFGQQAAAEYAQSVELEEAETVAPAIQTEPEPMESFRAAALAAGTHESLSTSDEWSADAAFEQEYVPSFEEVSEKAIASEAMTAAEKSPEPTVQVSGVSDRESSGEVNKAREPVCMKEQSLVEVLNASAQKDSATATDDRQQPSEPIYAAASTRFSGPYRISREVEQLDVLSDHEEHTARAWKPGIAYGAIFAMLVALFFYFARTTDKPGIEKSVKKTETANIEQGKAQTEQVTAQIEQPKVSTEQVKAKTEQGLVLTHQAKVQTEPPPAESRAPLELDLPANSPVDIEVYVVKKGDTLWRISKRFTGNPFNYPRIAGENSIADPDLIFPGQRIRLKK